MRLLITGICGFVGSCLASELLARIEGLDVVGFDNFSRPGSERNRNFLQKKGIRFFHGDMRCPSDLQNLPKTDCVIDAAANPSVLAGVDGTVSSGQIMEHNLTGTLHLLEYCKKHDSGLVILSTSRVYGIEALRTLPLSVKGDAVIPKIEAATAPAGLSEHGVSEDFSTASPLSLYGAAKLASEIVIREYGLAFDFPVHINRCGVLAGAGQFGKADQGIFSFWIHSYIQNRPLKYIGFGGAGHQVRDCLHPRDLAALIALQIRNPSKSGKILNVSGGMKNSMSLANLTRWCAERHGTRKIASQPEDRAFDIPWLVLDSRRAAADWGWQPETSINDILQEISRHALDHPEWLDLSNAS